MLCSSLSVQIKSIWELKKPKEQTLIKALESLKDLEEISGEALKTPWGK